MAVTAIADAYLLTMNRSFDRYPRGTLVFDDSGILALGPAADVAIPAGAEVIDGGGRLAVLPGFIDVHSHSSLLKGFTEDAQLMDWLPEYQREHQVLEPEDAYHACRISYLEALKGGTTTVVDMYRMLARGAEAAGELGLRVHLVPYAADHPDKGFFEKLEDNGRLIESHHGRRDGLVQVWIGLEHITYCSEGMYREARALAEATGCRIHTHTSEQKEEVDAVAALFGRRPVHQLDHYGILDAGTVLAHCVWLDEAEAAVLARTGTGVAHCPTSNMKLAGGTAPLERYGELGITVGLGSDGPISNNSLSMFEAMKLASLLQKVSRLDATAIGAREALELATIRGAELLGVADEVGSLEPGKAADVITVDLWQPHLLPVVAAEDQDPVPWNLVFAGRASDVRDVWVAGRRVVSGGRSTRVDEDRVLADASRQTAALLERRRRTAGVAMV